MDEEDYDELKNRLRPICKRTLRRQVLEYINYTNRKAIREEFYPSDDEQKLYDWVSEYLQRPKLYALPSSQRQLMTLILRKLLASSTYAIYGTLDTLVIKLEEILISNTPNLFDDVQADYESLEEQEEEWQEEDEEDDIIDIINYSDEDLEDIKIEIEDLKKSLEH
ncbi:hypothetical protein [Pedobacter sp. NJ-S-72]